MTWDCVVWSCDAAARLVVERFFISDKLLLSSPMLDLTSGVEREAMLCPVNELVVAAAQNSQHNIILSHEISLNKLEAAHARD